MTGKPDPVPDAVPARPWRPQDGPEPRITVYPPDARPALRVRHAGTWRYAVVLARQDHRGGRTVYQVEVRLPDERDRIEGTRIRLYAWPQPGLRRAHGPGPGQGNAPPPRG